MKEALDTGQLHSLAEHVLHGHPEEAQLRTLLDLGCRFAFTPAEDDPERIQIYFEHPDQDEPLGPLGDFPAEYAIPPWN